MSDGKINKVRLAGIVVAVGVVLLLLFKYSYLQVELSKVATILTAIAIIVGLFVEYLINKKK
jgi:putative flippase GtrA